MENKKEQFADLFKKFRLRSEFATLSEFADALAQEGLVYEESLFSHWQKGDRIPKDRQILLTTLNLFIKRGGISTIEETNKFLASAAQGYLTTDETKKIKSFFPPEKQIESLSSLKGIKSFRNILDYVEEEVALAYEKIYEGYPHMVYHSLGSLKKTIYDIGLHLDKRGQQVLSYLNWVRLRCLSDITKTKNFFHAYQQALLLLKFAKEKDGPELGPTYWVVSALKRLELITRPNRTGFTQKEVTECWEIGQLALKVTPHKRFSETLVEHLELAKIALILKNKDDFSRQMDLAFSAASKLPYQKKYLETMCWDVFARGNLRLEKNIVSALSNVHRAKKEAFRKYRAINLFLKNTELQALSNARDSAFSILAERLKEEIKIEASLINNPYQKIRLKQKKLIGL